MSNELSVGTEGRILDGIELEKFVKCEDRMLRKPELR